ncbi:unannotated protein [freshwater metagenome]|uniref:Unannotated protein n=1 Tax=freshwater metagenome TaxID=449393 RepID=A0A6J7G563_9ZZZZ
MAASSRALPRTNTTRAPSSRAAVEVAEAMSTPPSVSAGQVRWWSATVVTPHSSASASPADAAACASSASTPTAP